MQTYAFITIEITKINIARSFTATYSPTNLSVKTILKTLQDTHGRKVVQMQPLQIQMRPGVGSKDSQTNALRRESPRLQ